MFNKMCINLFGMGDPPCHEGGIDCPERTRDCHANCERFFTWDSERKKRKAVYDKRKEAERAYIDRYVGKLVKLGLNKYGKKLK